MKDRRSNSEYMARSLGHSPRSDERTAARAEARRRENEGKEVETRRARNGLHSCGGGGRRPILPRAAWVAAVAAFRVPSRESLGSLLD